MKARFDEEHNIEWARAIEGAGVHVVHGFPGLKIHAKVTLVVRRERAASALVHVSTGNYNASTARLYTDLSLFTADQISADVADLFNYLTGLAARSASGSYSWRRRRCARDSRGDPPRIRRGGQGKPTRIRLKLNALVDPTIIEELYSASAAGVPIDDPCARDLHAAPGREGLSLTIQVSSIVGRFLEHSRVYWFEAGDDDELYLGSADLMPRNLDRRIEVLTPVENARARAEIRAILDSALSDTTNTWMLAPTATGALEGKGKKTHTHQEAMMRRAQGRARRARS